MIVVATILALFMIYTRNMREYAAVFIWAFVAIAVRHWDQIPVIVWSAMVGALILFITTAVQAYKNRSALPFFSK